MTCHMFCIFLGIASSACDVFCTLIGNLSIDHLNFDLRASDGTLSSTSMYLFCLTCLDWVVSFHFRRQVVPSGVNCPDSGTCRSCHWIAFQFSLLSSESLRDFLILYESGTFSNSCRIRRACSDGFTAWRFALAWSSFTNPCSSLSIFHKMSGYFGKYLG